MNRLAFTSGCNFWFWCVCPQAVAMQKGCIESPSWPLGKCIQVGRGSNGKRYSTDDSGSENKTRGGRERALSHAAHRSESQLSAGPCD